LREVFKLFFSKAQLPQPQGQAHEVHGVHVGVAELLDIKQL
jgi:hypothetical protein